MDWTPGDCLRDAADLADKIDAEAALSIVHINRDGVYATEIRVAGLTLSSTIALLEIQKVKLVQAMSRHEEDEK